MDSKAKTKARLKIKLAVQAKEAENEPSKKLFSAYFTALAELAMVVERSLHAKGHLHSTLEHSKGH